MPSFFSSSSQTNSKQASKAAIKAAWKAEESALKADLKAIECSQKEKIQQAEKELELLKKQSKIDTERQIMYRVMESFKTVSESDAVKNAMANDPKTAKKMDKTFGWVEKAAMQAEAKWATSAVVASSDVHVGSRDPEMRQESAAPAYSSNETQHASDEKHKL